MITEKDLDLETLKFVEFHFNLYSDMSSKCQGYDYLCRLIDQVKVATETFEENKTFKIVGFNTVTNRQEKKRIYTSEADYLRYKEELIRRYAISCNVKCYELCDSKWVFTEYRSCDNMKID